MTLENEVVGLAAGHRAVENFDAAALADAFVDRVREEVLADRRMAKAKRVPAWPHQEGGVPEVLGEDLRQLDGVHAPQCLGQARHGGGKRLEPVLQLVVADRVLAATVQVQRESLKEPALLAQRNDVLGVVAGEDLFDEDVVQRDRLIVRPASFSSSSRPMVSRMKRSRMGRSASSRRL